MSTEKKTGSTKQEPKTPTSGAPKDDAKANKPLKETDLDKVAGGRLDPYK